MVWSRLVNCLPRGGLDPEAELADLDGLFVQVHAVEVVSEDLAVEVEEDALAFWGNEPATRFDGSL
jgi:hypothetical protein